MLLNINVNRHPETWALPWMKDPLMRRKGTLRSTFLDFCHSGGDSSPAMAGEE